MTLGLGAVGLALCVAPLVRHFRGRPPSAEDAVQAAQAVAAIASAMPSADDPSISRAAPREAGPPPLDGLDLTRVAIDDDGATAPAAGKRVARLTLDPDLQQTAAALMNAHHLPEASIVMIDPESGELVVYASHVEGGPPKDLAAEATAPAASIFKMITGAALVRYAGLGPDTRECYAGGGEHGLHTSDLTPDARRDRYCVTLGGAMGRSLNPVFARLAQRHLEAHQIEETAAAFGFGEKVPFEVDVAPSELHLPADPLGFARTAAGFWNSTLSPLQAAWMSATIARGGDLPRLAIVREVAEPAEPPLYTAPKPGSLRRAVSRETAQAIAQMMENTVSDGTSYRAFHDRSGRAFLAGVSVAGKTGTLTDPDGQRLYTWFTAFAPSRPIPGVKPVAIATLVVNRPAWHVKANVIAREMLRAYFADQGVAHVTRPSTSTSVAHR